MRTHINTTLKLTLTLSLALALSLPATAAVRKLNAPLPAGGYVTGFEVSSDGRFVVYHADQHIHEVYELFSVPAAGGSPVRLNLPLPPGGDVISFQVSQDGSRVVYIADQQTDETFELFSAPIDGPASASIKLNPPLVAGGDVDYFEISADGKRVVYRADQQSDEVNELFSVPIDGPASASIKLNPPLVTGGDVDHFGISPDGSRVVYRADQHINDVFDLFSAPITGPANATVQLNSPLVAGRSVDGFRISPDGSRVVYTSDEVSAGIFELFSVPITGPASSNVRLHRSVTQPRGVDRFQISPDSTRVVYRSNQRTSDALELFSVPITGPDTASVQLSLDLSKNLEVYSFRISPDSSRVVYVADWRADEVYELLSVPINGPASAGVGVDPPLPLGGDVHDFRISPDSRRVVYRADQRFDDKFELVSAPLAGGSLVFLNRPLITGGDVRHHQISPDSRHVIYLADQETDNAIDMFRVPLTGPSDAGVALSPPQVAGREVFDFAFIPGRNWVVYHADQDTDEQNELYVVDDGQPQVRVATASLQVSEAIGSARISVTLSQPTVLTVTLQVAVTAGTASSGADYTPLAGTLSVAPGETSAALEVPIINDDLAEPPESLGITFSNPTNAIFSGANTATLVILDEDTPGPRTPTPMPTPTPTPTPAPTPAGGHKVHLPLVTR